MSSVALVKGERSLETVYRALDLIPYKDSFNDWEKVLIKVNFITTKDWSTGATTDPIIVEAIINRLRDLGKDVIIVESDAQTTNASKAWVASGMEELGKRLDVPFINMRHVDEKVELEIKRGHVLKKIKVAKIATESAIVSAAKLKTHMSTNVTLGMKNMFGMLTTKFKGKYHIRGMDKVVHDIAVTLPPQLTVIDGFVAMEGRGPVHGKPVQMDTVIASTDVVGADAIASRIMGFNPERIDHIRWADESGLGTMNPEVVGDTIESVKRIFDRAR
ncbi:DUF362 domain-containing protein [Candidatus Bathyarchaeota archaeon]|nr:DUF362 domain-containing protein [Candidatus Bathyarchaeota archaeon]MBT4321003.1 DUF362 domain-containing protein [Candidatus Bathyarchaeota archaeon]MBT5641778.1 DUF362 domain-containing protein [Candidatus Bathyarchaeota archaeon]MBT6604541.1 DUF362 domain-containing protein [Candidatus Bathyarchaeota archaeon]MBT7187906.1 DUF362 domain-containing protein [Candidatus Bathyarchaeota archaeon]